VDVLLNYITKLDRIQKILETLEGVNVLNASKKRDEAVQLLHKFFPQMENLATQFRKYRKEFEWQARENAALKKEIADSKLGLNECLQMYDLQNKYEKLRTIYCRIPEKERQKAVKSLQPQRQSRDSHERGG